MVNGKNFWGEEYLQGFRSVALDRGLRVDTYEKLPENLYGALEASARSFPKQTALVEEEMESCTYQELFVLCGQISDFLSSRYQLYRGKRVALLMSAGIGFCACLLALQKLGVAVAPLPSKFRREEILSLLEKTHPDLILCTQEYEAYFTHTFRPVCRYPFSDPFPRAKVKKSSCRPGDAGILLFTSGTTSQSKAVELKHYQIIHAAKIYQSIFHLTHEDKAVLPVPIYHVTGLIALLGAMILAGGTLYLQKKFNPRQVLQCVSDHHVTYLHGSPTVFHLLMEQQKSFPFLPSLRILACGSGNMPPEKIVRLHQWLPNAEFRTVYGLTETTSPASIFPQDAAQSPHIGSSGLVIPGMEVKIVGETGDELPDGVPGEILLRGTNVAAPIGQWLHTEDIGYLTPDHYLYVVDRKKDMINCGGEKVWCFDVENALCRIPGIREAAVVSIYDPLYGEVPGAAVSLEPGSQFTEKQLQELLFPKLAKFKIPKKIIFLTEIPKTANGKTDKRKLKSLLNREESSHAES